MSSSSKVIDEYIHPIHKFYKVMEEGFEYTLPEYTLGLINKISKKVGAPSYIKTPVFNKVQVPKHKGRRRRRKQREDESWNDLNVFKGETTETKKVDHIESILTTVYGMLNKITAATYDDVRDSIFSSITTLFSYYETSEDFSIPQNEAQTRIVKNIFDVASHNKLYCDLYSRLTHDLTERFDTLMEQYRSEYKERTSDIVVVEFCDDDDDYDKQCEINMRNDERRCTLKFICCLMKQGMVDKEEVFHIMNQFVDMLDESIDKEGNKMLCDELSNVIEEFINTVFHDFKEHNGFKCIWEQLVKISEYKVKNHVSLTNKCSFKILDIVEEYEDDIEID